MGLRKIIVNAAVVTSLLYPISAYGEDRYMENTRKQWGVIKDKARGWLNKSEHEKAKDMAGAASSVPGARQIIEYIDKKNKEEGFYEKQRRNKTEGPKRVREFNPFRRR